MKIDWKTGVATAGVVAVLSLGMAGVIYADTTPVPNTINSFCGKLNSLREDTLNKKINSYGNSYIKTTSSTVFRNEKKVLSDRKTYEKRIAWSASSTEKLVKKEYRNFSDKSNQALSDYRADIDGAVEVRSSTVRAALDAYAVKVSVANATMASNTLEYLRVLRADYDALTSSTQALCDSGASLSSARQHYNSGWKVLYDKYLKAKKESSKTTSSIINTARKDFLNVFATAKKTYDDSLVTSRGQMHLEYDKKDGKDETPPSNQVVNLPDVAFDSTPGEDVIISTRVVGNLIVKYVNKGSGDFSLVKDGIRATFLDANKNEIVSMRADLEVAVKNTGDAKAATFDMSNLPLAKYVRINLDVDGAIAESDEGNNFVEKAL